jgi:hypothetical protein
VEGGGVGCEAIDQRGTEIALHDEGDASVVAESGPAGAGGSGSGGVGGGSGVREDVGSAGGSGGSAGGVMADGSGGTAKDGSGEIGAFARSANLLPRRPSARPSFGDLDGETGSFFVLGDEEEDTARACAGRVHEDFGL